MIESLGRNIVLEPTSLALSSTLVAHLN